MVQSLRLYHFYCPNELLRPSPQGDIRAACRTGMPDLSDAGRRRGDGPGERKEGERGDFRALTEEFYCIRFWDYGTIDANERMEIQA